MTSEEEVSVSDLLLPAARHEAIEAKVCEISTRLDRSTCLASLYLPDDQCPDNGKLQEEAYRTPWIREKVFSDCKLSLGTCSFENLDEGMPALVAPERFIVRYDPEIIPSSNPDSPMGSDLDEYLSEETHPSDLFQESFVKYTLDNKSEDLFLPEELLPVNHLAQFGNHLPTLKAKLSRLRILPVDDPLLSSTGGCVSEEAVFSCFQHCESYKQPPDVDRSHVKECALIHQEFVKEPLTNNESLLLDDPLETDEPNTDNCFSFSTIRDHANLSPEMLDERRSVLEEFQASFSDVSMEGISKYRPPENVGEDCTVDTAPMDVEERAKLLPELELDVTFSPTLKKSLRHACLTTSELQKEELPPLFPLYLLSATAQEEMQVALWRAEKCPNFVLRFLLAEPENEPAADFEPLREALKAFQFETQSLTHTGDHLQSQMEIAGQQEDLWCDHMFTESIKSESNLNVEEREEVFRKMCLEGDEDFTEKLNRFDKTPPRSNQNASFATLVNTNNKDVSPLVMTSTSLSDETFSGASVRAFVQADVTLPGKAGSTRANISHDGRQKTFTRHPPEMEYDPVSAFMMLRSQPVVSVPATHQSPAIITEEPVAPMLQNTQSRLGLSQPHRTSGDTTDERPGHMRTVISGKATREQSPVPHCMDKVIGLGLDQQETPESTVVQVEATDSQKRSYRELLAFALPCLSSARQQGLNIPPQREFSQLAPDQTHFLLKQQERALHWSAVQSPECIRDHELLLNQAVLIHSLVTFKELLLKCNLRTALDYLSRVAKKDAEKGLQELLKRQQIIFFLSQRNHEPNLKLQELQQLLAERLQSGNTTLNVTGKILVVTSAEYDDSGSSIVTSLKQSTGAAVTAVYPQEGMKKLNGASMVSSIQACVCALVSEQHIGPDFPWSCFSLLVEYDHPGHSPWSTVCRERGIGHLAFSTSHSDADDHNASWRLQDDVPYVLLVTGRLLNWQLLLQALESNFNMNVLERSSSPTLEMLGGIQNYTVITVDENTVIVIQEHDELCQERVSETLVMRLIALSLQYNCCWLILFCPGSQRPEFHGEAFNNLALLYSSLVVFNMQSEFELDVKVLLVSDVLEMAKWISQICFNSLMCSDQDPAVYLSRDWLTVIPSQDEVYLTQFPCINPLVAPLMLRKAPSLQWLMRAPLTQLKELLPEVSNKVLKLFTDLTAQYLPPIDLDPSWTTHQDSPPLSLWNQALKHMNPSQADISRSLFGGGDTQGSFSEPRPESVEREDDLDFSLDFLSCPFGSWVSGDPWRQEETLPVWTSRAGVVGGVVEKRNYDHQINRQNQGSPFTLDSTFSCRPVQWPPESSHMHTLPTVYHDLHRLSGPGSLSLPSSAPWDRVRSGSLNSGGGMMAASAGYSSRCWAGRERKRSGEEAGLFGSVLTPAKRRELSYERIPGRRDGQTRLRLL